MKEFGVEVLHSNAAIVPVRVYTRYSLQEEKRRPVVGDGTTLQLRSLLIGTDYKALQDFILLYLGDAQLHSSVQLLNQ